MTGPIDIAKGDLDAGARTVWAEARGEGFVGMCAVASVLANRTRIAKAYVGKHGRPHPLFGDGTLRSAATWRVRPDAKHQFSCWNEDDPNLPKLKAVDTTDEAFRWALYAMLGVTLGHIIDPTREATHYMNRAWLDRVKWDDGMMVTAEIGKHVFFKEKPWAQKGA